MKFLLKLKNKENRFVGAAFLISDISKNVIEDLFRSSVIEHDWSEDNTLGNAIEILFNAIYNVKESEGGITYINGFDYSKKAEIFVKKNLYRTFDFLEDKSIFLEERWVSSAEDFADEIIQITEPDNFVY